MSVVDGTLSGYRGSEPIASKYSTEDAGTVTQATSPTTAVTINASHGAITMQAVASANTKYQFTVNNDRCLAGSIVLAIVEGKTVTSGEPLRVGIDAVADGSFNVIVHNHHATNDSDAAPIVHFHLISPSSRV